MSGRTRRTLAIAWVVAAGLAGPAAGQEPWKDSYYPYLVGGPNDKVTLVFHYHYGQAADYYDKVPFAKAFSAEAGANADGSRFAVARFKGPRITAGSRIWAEAGTTRENRFGYYGLGNDTEPARTPGNRHADQMRRTRYFLRLDATQQLGPVLLSAATTVTRTEFGRLPGATAFGAACPAPPLPGAVPPGCRDDTDVVGRGAVIFDTRDREFVTAKGVYLEAGAYTGSGGGGYSGVYGQAKAFVSPREGMVFAGRVLGRWLDEEAPLDARYEVPAWEQNIPVLGGPESHRSFVYGRFAGRDLLLINLEYRQDILNLGDYGAFTAVGFLDAGRVAEFEGMTGATESRDLHIGGGAGLALRILRSTVLSFNWAWGGDGHLFSMGTGWMF